MKKFLIRDAEAGNPIQSFDTLEDAKEVLAEFLEEDAKDGFTDNIYEIYDTEENEIIE